MNHTFNILTPRVQQIRQSIIETLLAQPEAYFHPLREELARKGMGSLPALPQPYILPQEARHTIQFVGEHIAQAFEFVCQKAYKEGLDKHTPRLQPKSRALLDAHLEADMPFMYCARFDGLLDEETGHFTLLECNAGDPSGEGFTDTILDIILQTRLLEKAGVPQECIFDRLIDAHFDLTQQHPPWTSLRPNTRWVRLTNTDSFIYHDHRMFAERYKALGQVIELVDARDCHHDGKQLLHREKPIDVVLRDTIDELILPPFWPKSQHVLDAYTHGHVHMLNPLKTLLGDDKGLLELLSLAHMDDKLPQETRAILAQYVPWTRIIRQQETTHGTKHIALLPFIHKHREELVLKPVEGYGGYGITIGPESSPSDWQHAVEQAMQLPGSAIAQTYTPVPQAPFVVQSPDGFYTTQPKKMTLSFWIHYGKFAGCFARVSDDTIINLHQGGALLPVVYI